MKPKPKPKFRVRSPASPKSILEDVTPTEEEITKQARARCLRAIHDRLSRFKAIPAELQLTVMKGIVYIAAPRLKNRLFLDYKAKHWRHLHDAVLSKGYGIGKRDLFDALLSHIDYVSQTQLVKYDPDQTKSKTKFRIRPRTDTTAKHKGDPVKTSLPAQKKSVRRKGA